MRSGAVGSPSDPFWFPLTSVGLFHSCDDNDGLLPASVQQPGGGQVGSLTGGLPEPPDGRRLESQVAQIQGTAISTPPREQSNPSKNENHATCHTAQQFRRLASLVFPGWAAQSLLAIVSGGDGCGTLPTEPCSADNGNTTPIVC